MFDRVIAYGCSHTAAYETNDTQWRLDADNYKLKHGVAEFYNFIGRTYPGKWDYQRHIENQKENSFANVLARLMKVPCINNAIPGNSLAQIVWQIDTDLANDQITNCDLILIGLPTPNRVIHFTDQAAETLRLTDNSHYANFQFDQRTIVNYFNREQTTFLYLAYLRILLYLEKTKLPGQLLLLNPDGHAQTLFNFIQTVDQDSNLMKYFQKTTFGIFQEINAMPIWLDNANTKLYNDNDTSHAGMHATAEMHSRYAEKLFKNLKEITHDQYI
jgi:hypothetical protein